MYKLNLKLLVFFGWFVVVMLMGCVFSAQVRAQQAAAPAVEWIQDSALTRLVNLYRQYHFYANRFHKGYRVQVISTDDRERANQVRALLLQRFPQYRAYLQYHAPYFRVRVGDFLNQEDAIPLRDTLREIFSSGVFIVPDVIDAEAILPSSR
ncbi:SPOR domain-containing protein [Thermoflavifilum thermophilum]|uniref:Sporulation related domain-containing protein n=1 Tax=Thermoflavifilum thermophilum TaxID=1393122 RepID=A0A1I7NDE0_9BACT|nr:SPOR domain-containing protein [Thermoflavifilum thermophilum]SFV32698.1 Sporulation related domain-containing protein [Thermoflavifilum thermophilum]